MTLNINTLFDESYYLAQNPDVANAVASDAFSSGLDHFLQYGQFEGRDPSPLFNTSFYLTKYPDVGEAIANGVIESAFDHFLNYGQYEGRDPSLLFNTSFYLTKYPDVGEAIANGVIESAFDHFLNYGQYEGRDPNPLFDTRFYLQENPDVTIAVMRGEVSSPFEHFIDYGQYEGRDPGPQFDTQFYLTKYPDVGEAIANGVIESAFNHFLNYGQYEGRDPNPVFDTSYYLENNPDVAEAIANGEIESAFNHFLQYGQQEGRDPGPVFDESFYLIQNPDVAVAVARGIYRSGYEHFLLYGQYEGRDPNPGFDENYYLAENPDVAEAVARGVYKSGVEHFLQYGQYEGRVAVDPAYVTIADFRWKQTNSVSSATVVEGAIDTFVPNAFGKNFFGFDFSKTTGQLLSDNTSPNTTAVAANFPDLGRPGDPQPNVDRTTIEMNWNGAELPNAPGNDFVIYESSFSGEPEGYLVSVRRAGEDNFSVWRYEFAESFEQFDPVTGAGVYATAFDLDNFGISPSDTIDAIEIRNIFNSEAVAGGDRVDDRSGQGNVLFPGTPGYNRGFTLPTAFLAPGIEYSTDKLDADITYVVGLHDIVGPTAFA